MHSPPARLEREAFGAKPFAPDPQDACHADAVRQHVIILGIADG
jgi:hypothetical protein